MHAAFFFHTVDAIIYLRVINRLNEGPMERNILWGTKDTVLRTLLHQTNIVLHVKLINISEITTEEIIHWYRPPFTFARSYLPYQPKSNPQTCVTLG